MIRLDLAEVELDNIAEVLDDPDIAPRFKNRLLIVMMPREGVQHGVVARCLKVNADTVTNNS